MSRSTIAEPLVDRRAAHEVHYAQAMTEDEIAAIDQRANTINI